MTELGLLASRNAYDANQIPLTEDSLLSSELIDLLNPTISTRVGELFIRPATPRPLTQSTATLHHAPVTTPASLAPRPQRRARLRRLQLLRIRW